MTDIATIAGARTGSRVMVGPGLSQKLVGSVIPTLLMERTFDKQNWYSAMYQFHTDPETDTAGEVTLTETGVGTTDFADVNTIRVMTYNSGATSGNGVTIGPNTGALSGATNFWDANLQPYIVAGFAMDSDAAALINADATIGFSDTNPAILVAAATSGEANGARWIVENGAAAANWFAETSVGGLDARFDTGQISLSQTLVHLGVFFDKARRPFYFFNGKLVKVGPSMTAALQMAPHVQGTTGTTAARAFGFAYVGWGQRWVA